jgi:hypothetical protein
MHTLDLLTILCLGILTGNELAVSLFVNPAIWKLNESAQAQALSLLARSLGKVMPIWYALCLILLIVEAYVRRHSQHAPLLYGAVILWTAVIIYTVFTLLPINNRIAGLDLASLPAGWRQEHRKWDGLHRWRIGMVAIATAFLVWGILPVS